MATISAPPETASMDAFRAAIPSHGGAHGTTERLCAIGQYRALASGDELRAHAEQDRLVFIASGSAKLVAETQGASSDQTQTGTRSQILAFHFGGDMISVLQRSSGDFRLVALSDVELVLFGARQFLDIAQDEPAVLRSVLSRSLQALHRSRTKMMQLAHKSARQRIAVFLVSMAERICGCTCGDCEFALPMSRRDIGDSLGLTIETVSRQFTELREAGIVTTTGRSLVRINDFAALHAEAGLKSQTNFCET